MILAYLWPLRDFPSPNLRSFLWDMMGYALGTCVATALNVVERPTLYLKVLQSIRYLWDGLHLPKIKVVRVFYEGWMECFWVGFLSMYKSYWPGSSPSMWREWACALWETHRSNQGTRRLGPPSGNQYLWSFWLTLTNTIRSKSKYHWWWDEHCLSNWSTCFWVMKEYDLTKKDREEK